MRKLNNRSWITASIFLRFINLARNYFTRILMDFGNIVLDIQWNKIRLKVAKINLVLRMRKKSLIIYVNGIDVFLYTSAAIFLILKDFLTHQI